MFGSDSKDFSDGGRIESETNVENETETNSGLLRVWLHNTSSITVPTPSMSSLVLCCILFASRMATFVP